MSALPLYELDEVATKGDIARLGTRIDSLSASLDGLTARVDKLIFGTFAGLVAVLVATIGATIASLG